jgi:L-malate glycosyltransferase
MRVLVVTSGGNIHDERFIAKFVQSDLEFHVAMMRPRMGDTPAIATSALVARKRLTRLRHRLSAGPRAFLELRRLIRRFQPQVVQAGPVNTGGLLAVLTGFRPIVLMVWGSDVLVFPKRSRIHRRLVRAVLRRADAIACDVTAVSDAVRDIGSVEPERIVTFPWGVDLSVFKPMTDARRRVRAELGLRNEPVAIMTRNFLPVYGIEYFIDAIPRIRSLVPDARFLFAGDGPLEGALRARVQGLGLDLVVTFLGQVSQLEMADYLNAADVYVSSSLSDGTSISLLEAMACRLPPVVTDVPSNRDWVTNNWNGLVVRHRDSDAIADAVVRLLGDRTLASGMGDRSLAIARERGDWDSNYEVLEGIYKAVVQRRGQLERRRVL